jgi:predicted nucleic-acid-binding protein
VIALDTNVLVRFLVRDDERQSARAEALVRRTAAAGEPLFVSDVTLCELVWVLGTAYEIPRAEIAAGLRRLASAAQLLFRRPDAIRRAIEAYASRRGDFADYLILEHASEAGCSAVATFDRALLREPGFVKV